MSAAEVETVEEFTPTAGMHLGLPMDVYRKANAVSASDLKNMQRSPAYARMKHRGSSASTDAQEWGTAIHTAILEPETMGERYELDPECPKRGGYPAGWRNTKAYKEARSEIMARPGIEGVLTNAQFDDLVWIRERVKKDEIGAQLYELDGVREASIFAYDDEFDLWRKIRPDWYIEAAAMAIDVKSCRDHTPGPFSRACLSFGYHLSAAWYIDTARIAGLDYDHNPFLAINSAAPFEPASYVLDEDSIEQGRRDYRRALHQWRECVEQQHWPAGEGRISEIRIPEYAIKVSEVL